MRAARQINLRHPRNERIDRIEDCRRRRGQAEPGPASGQVNRLVTARQQAIVTDGFEPCNALHRITGFRRARNFGLLHPNCKRLIALLQLLLKFDRARALAWVKQRAPIICTCCGAVMTIVRTRIRTLFARPAPIPIDAGGAR